MSYLDRKVKKMVLAGIGAAALAREESNGLFQELVKRGETVIESSGIRNETLHRNQDNNTESARDADVDSWLETLSNMTPEQLSVLKDAIDSLEWASDSPALEKLDIDNEEE